MSFDRSSCLFAALSLTTIASLYACDDSPSSGNGNGFDAGVTEPGFDAGRTPPPPTPPASGDAGTDGGSKRVYTGASGVLDATFATKGYVVTSGALGGVRDYAHAVAIDSKDRIIGAGASEDAMGFRGFAAWRVSVDGTLDSTFGTNGAWAISNTLGGGKYGELWGAAVDAQDRVLLTGQANNGSPIYMTIWRLTAAGAPDTTWNTTGQTGQANGGNLGYDTGFAIRPDKDGNVVAVGFSKPDNTAQDSAIWRYTSAGALDTSFNTTGYVTGHATLGSNPSTQYNQAVAFDSQKRVIAAGWAYDASSAFHAILYRYTAAGALDTTFNTTGYVDVSSQNVINSVVVDAQDRFVICGQGTKAGQPHAFVGRLTAAGALDATFGTNGFLVLDPPADNLRSIARGCALDAQGRVIVAGLTQNGTGPGRVAVWRVTSAGALDTTYATQGVFLGTGAAGGTADVGWSVAIDSAGCAVVAGESADSNGNAKTAFWRLTP